MTIEVCIRAIIQKGKKILVCKSKKKGYYFFPGGHLDFGESVKDALLREIKEELNITVKKYSFIGMVENIFIEDNQKHHEIDLVFDIIVDKLSDKSKEDHIDFFFMDINNFAQEDVLPVALKKAVLKWLKDKKFFWASR